MKNSMVHTNLKYAYPSFTWHIRVKKRKKLLIYVPYFFIK